MKSFKLDKGKGIRREALFVGILVTAGSLPVFFILSRLLGIVTVTVGFLLVVIGAGESE